MKKSVLAIVFITVLASSYAQSIVPRAGLVLSTIPSDDEEIGQEISSRTGFTIGAGFNIPVNEKFSIQPELNFIQKGAKLSYSFTESGNGYSYTESIEFDLAHNYLEIPVLAEFAFGGDTKFILAVGPSIGFGIGGKAKIDFAISETINGETETASASATGNIKYGSEPENDESTNIYFENRMDFGAQFGIGVLIKDLILIEARYGLGLSSLDEDESMINSALQFSVAVPIRLNK